MSKNVMILFSGGLDSTYLMWKNLKDGNDVFPVYLEITNNRNKVFVEKQQIELILSELNKEFDKHIEIEYGIQFGLKGWNNNVSFSQPLIWSLCMAFAVGKNIDEIQMGYVMGDDALLWLKEIKKLFYATKPFTHKTPKLKFPLIDEKLHKYNLIDNLPKQYQSLVSSCEEPILSKIGMRYKGKSYRIFEPCCRCVPCKKTIADDYHGSGIIREKYRYPYYKWMKREIEEFETQEFCMKNEKSIDAPKLLGKSEIEYEEK